MLFAPPHPVTALIILIGAALRQLLDEPGEPLARPFPFFGE